MITRVDAKGIKEKRKRKCFWSEELDEKGIA